MGFALDEISFNVWLDGLKKLRQAGLKAIIIKPAMIGGISKSIDYIKTARKLGVTPVISSSYEAGPGFVYEMKLACYAGTRTSHGLDTLKQ